MEAVFVFLNLVTVAAFMVTVILGVAGFVFWLDGEKFSPAFTFVAAICGVVSGAGFVLIAVAF